jgi:hypothetical protein
MRRKFNLSHYSGCAYEFRAFLVLLRSCSRKLKTWVAWVRSGYFATVTRPRDAGRICFISHNPVWGASELTTWELNRFGQH